MYYGQLSSALPAVKFTASGPYTRWRYNFTDSDRWALQVCGRNQDWSNQTSALCDGLLHAMFCWGRSLKLKIMDKQLLPTSLETYQAKMVNWTLFR
jgi:hypothetical protein